MLLCSCTLYSCVERSGSVTSMELILFSLTSGLIEPPGPQRASSTLGPHFYSDTTNGDLGLLSFPVWTQALIIIFEHVGSILSRATGSLFADFVVPPLCCARWSCRCCRLDCYLFALLLSMIVLRLLLLLLRMQ